MGPQSAFVHRPALPRLVSIIVSLVIIYQSVTCYYIVFELYYSSLAIQYIFNLVRDYIPCFAIYSFVSSSTLNIFVDLGYTYPFLDVAYDFPEGRG